MNKDDIERMKIPGPEGSCIHNDGDEEHLIEMLKTSKTPTSNMTKLTADEFEALLMAMYKIGIEDGKNGLVDLLKDGDLEKFYKSAVVKLYEENNLIPPTTYKKPMTKQQAAEEYQQQQGTNYPIPIEYKVMIESQLRAAFIAGYEHKEKRQ